MKLNEVVAAFPASLPLPHPVIRAEEERLALGCLGRLQREFGRPYYQPLALAVLVTMRTICGNSALTRTGVLARFLKVCFEAYGLREMSEWRPEVYLAAALANQIPGVSPASAMHAVDAFLAFQRDLQEWFGRLPASDQAALAPFLLAPINDPHRIWRHAPGRDVLHPRERILAQRLDVLTTVYDDLPGALDDRWQFLLDLEAAAQSGRGEVTIVQGGRCHSFRFWRHFVPGRVETICEYLGGDGPFPWFIELLKCRAILTWWSGRAAVASVGGLKGLPHTYFRSDDPGVLRPEEHEGRLARQLFLRQKALCFPLSPLIVAATVGRAALQIMFSCGARASEVSQLTEPRLERDGWYFPGLAKGAKAVWFPLSPTAANDARSLAMRVRRHYRLAEDAPIPVVPSRERRPALPEGPYLFQWRGRQLCRNTITACYRFLLFGLVQDNGREAHLHTHLFRHARANLWHQKQGMGLGVIGGILHHEDIQTTYRYVRPTASQCLRAALEAARRRP